MPTEPNALKVMVIAGTRPEWIRLSCCIHRLKETVDTVVVHTGQNYDFELNEVFFQDLELGKPDHFLDAAGANAAETIGAVIAKSDRVLRDESPDAVLLLGDTNSCMAAIAARKNKVPVYHMEAGNRCFDFNVPEELNRRIVDHASDFNLCYTEHARRHLLSEGLPHRRCFVTGSPMNEVLARFRPSIDASTVLEELELEPKGYFLASFHREENVDNPTNLKSIITALETLCEKYDLPAVISTHPRTRKRMEAFDIEGSSRLRFLKPFGFHAYNKLQLECRCALSDSGTISEESSMLKFPAVTIRNALERPEALDTGSILLTGLNSTAVIACVEEAVRGFEAGEFPEMPIDYQITNTSQRVVRLILGTTGLNAKWHGLEQ